jgi:CelD/BcsL family acetyltransferase involved in cellulose biosynthesis
VPIGGPHVLTADVRLTSLTAAEANNPAFVARWDDLARRTADPNPFCESWFLLPSLHHLDPDDEVRLLALESDGQLCGIIPLRRYPSYYRYPLPHWRNWVHDNAFCGQPLVAPGFEAPFWRAVLDWVDAHAGQALFLHLTQMPAHGPVHAALKDTLAHESRAAATVHAEERAMLASTLSGEAYLEQAMPGKKRKELRRQQRRLAELGTLEVQRLAEPADVSGWAERFLTLERKGWKGKAGSALTCDAANAAIFAQVLAGAARRGRVECLSLLLDGRDIAMLASFVTPPGAYSFKTTFDEDFARFSPGVLLQCENLAMLARPEVAWTDSCAVQDHAMIDHIWRERRPMARHSIAIGGAARRKLFTLLSRRETGRAPGGIA